MRATTAGQPAPHLYFDRNFALPAAKILPGGCHVSTEDTIIATVLGSCVAACIRDRHSGIGGMNHFMLPDSSAEGEHPGSARYGVHAMELLLNRLAKMGAVRSRLEAKVFGGGAVIAHMTSSEVGRRNAAFVLQFLETEGIPVVARDLEGIYPRKVYFFPRQGRVLVRHLREMHNNTVAVRESEYRQQLKKSPIAGEVELFV